MAAHSVSQTADESRVFNAMETTDDATQDPGAIPPKHDTDMSDRPGPTSPGDRLADLRRRRHELVDVLADTLLERVLKAPLGPRRAPARAQGRETVSG